jgi:protein-L-isoaspartate(D-aspartate) O-methyltransferase
MVKEQIESRGIRDKRILNALEKVQRHLFVPEEHREMAYADFPLSIGERQTISQPYMVALMTEVASPGADERILEIGTGSGYQTAVLAELACRVYSIERLPTLHLRAAGLLAQLGYTNVLTRTGDGSLGWEEFAPFDKIIVTAASMQVPQPLLDQVRPWGRIVIPVGDRDRQVLRVLEKQAGGGLKVSDICSCVFVPLIGKYAYGANSS